MELWNTITELTYFYYNFITKCAEVLVEPDVNYIPDEEDMV
jgi:hypothetical protein